MRKATLEDAAFVAGANSSLAKETESIELDSATVRRCAPQSNQSPTECGASRFDVDHISQQYLCPARWTRASGL